MSQLLLEFSNNQALARQYSPYNTIENDNHSKKSYDDDQFQTPDQESTEVSESEILKLMMFDMVKNNFKQQQTDKQMFSQKSNENFISSSQQSQSRKPQNNKKPMQLSLWSFFNPHKNTEIVQSQKSDASMSSQSQNSGKDQNSQSDRPQNIIVEESIDNPFIRVNVPSKVKNTERHLLEQLKDIESKKLFEIDEDNQSSQHSWLIDTEIIEINKLLYKRKQMCKQLLQDLIL